MEVCDQIIYNVYAIWAVESMLGVFMSFMTSVNSISVRFSDALGFKFGEWISYLTQEKSPPPYEGPLNGDYWANKLTAVPIFSSRVLIGKEELANLLWKIASSDVFSQRLAFAENLGEGTKIGIVAVAIARQLLKSPSLMISESFDYDKRIDWEFCRRLAGYVYYRQQAKKEH